MRASRWLTLFILLAGGAAGSGGAEQQRLDLPRIGCWNEAAEGENGTARVLYGIPGNLVVRPLAEGDGCANEAQFGEPDDKGVRTLRIDSRWQLAETREGERYLLYRSTQRYELPQ